MKQTQKNEVMQKLHEANRRYVYLLEAFKIPNKKIEDTVYSEYLLEGGGKKTFPKKKNDDDQAQQEARMEVMKNKISSKYLSRKRKLAPESKAVRKQILKKNNLKKSLRKLKNIGQRSEHIKEEQIDQKGKVQETTLFNAESKIVFSKIQFDENDVPRKGVETDAKKLLRKVLQDKQKLNEIKLSGDNAKYAEVRSKKAWDRATAKTLGQKVRDDLGLLSKKIQKRKKQITKSKQEWAQRAQKVEHIKSTKQKQRMENIKERADKKKNKKMQKLAKKGRIIPGF